MIKDTFIDILPTEKNNYNKETQTTNETCSTYIKLGEIETNFNSKSITCIFKKKIKRSNLN